MEKTSLAERLAASMNRHTLDRIGALALDNARANADDARRGPSITRLREVALGEGDAAVVIAAGPSLHRQDTARILKDSGFKGTIVATESAMAWCLRNGMKPHVVVTVDPHPDRIVRWFGDPKLDEDALARDDYFSRQDMDPAFRHNQLEQNRHLVDLVDRHGHDIHICVSSSASQAVVSRCRQARMPTYWFNPVLDDYDLPDSLTRRVRALNGKPCLNAGGNVGTACWVVAHAVLGKKNIALLGMDFGYYGDTTYKETQYHTELVDLLGEDRVGEAFHHVHNPFVDKEFFTDPAYYWYREVFLEMAAEAAADGVATCNCSGGGILFGPGIDWSSFADFVARTGA